MPRYFERSISPIPDVDVPDWELIERIGTLFGQYQTDFGQLKFHAEDSRGSYHENVLAAFKTEVEAQDELPKRVRITLDGEGLRLHIWFGADNYDRGAVFEGTDEAAVVLVADRCTDFLRKAKERRGARLATEEEKRRQEEAMTPSAEVRPVGPVRAVPLATSSTARGSGWRRLAYDPWVIGIGTAVVAAAIFAIVAALTR